MTLAHGYVIFPHKSAHIDGFYWIDMTQWKAAMFCPN